MSLSSFAVPVMIVATSGVLAFAPPTRHEPATPSVLGVRAAAAHISVAGRNLSRVEIFAVPPDQDDEDDDKNPERLGEAVKNHRNTDRAEIWLFPRPSRSFKAVEIFAEGFDREGKSVGKVPLSYLNADGLYDSLYKSIHLEVRPQGRDRQEENPR